MPGEGGFRNTLDLNGEISHQVGNVRCGRQRTIDVPNVAIGHAFDAFFHPEVNIAYVRESGLLDGLEPREGIICYQTPGSLKQQDR
jgi:hypothetical protein